MKIIKEYIIFILVILVFLFYCISFLIKNEKSKSEFKPPLQPYGLPYRVGSLGGKPVNLGEGVEYLEYEDFRFLSKDKKNTNHNYNSKVVSFGFNFRYSDELFLVKYYKAPQKAYSVYKAEHFSPDNQWVRVGVDGENPDPDFPARRFKYSTELKNYSKEYEYYRVYISTNEIEYGLEKYIPHSSWVERNNRLRKKNGNKSIYYIDDWYVQKDKSGKILTLIACSTIDTPLARRCSQEFSIQPYMKGVSVSATFQRVHLKDWQQIQQSATKIIKSFIVEQNH